MQSPAIKPVNFRVNRFILGGKEVLIAGMARPNHPRVDASVVDARLKYLHDDAQRTVLIGLYQDSFGAQATAQGLEYHFIPVHDLPNPPVPIEPETYDKIYEVVKNATNEGKLVTIHCGAGDGRTGTALASLKLRELLEQQASTNGNTLDDVPQKTEVVRVSFFGDQDVPCTPLVKQAVEAVRQQRIVGSHSDVSGSHSVETENDINTLLNYEAHLRQKIKLERQAQAGSALDRAPGAEQIQERKQVSEIDTEQQMIMQSLLINLTLCDRTHKTQTCLDGFFVYIKALTEFVAQASCQDAPEPACGARGSSSFYGFFSDISKAPSKIIEPQNDLTKK